MAIRRNLPSIVLPITLGAVTVPITTALLVGWTLLLGKRISEHEVAGNIWLLILGAIAFSAVITTLVLFTYFLVREIREVRRQDTFIDSVTHELKSPLASLKLCVETLGRRNLIEEQRDKVRTMMIHDLDRLTSFIDDVLQASRLAHEDGMINLSDVDLKNMIQNCATTMIARHHLEDDVIQIDVPSNLYISTDRAAVEIIVKNLIDNAIKYSKEKVNVHVCVRIDAHKKMILEVQDHGIGIKKEHLSRIFDRFYRVDTESVRKRYGTGLGLFVVSALVRNLGGSITALSEGSGHGTTMRVVFPRVVVVPFIPK